MLKSEVLIVGGGPAGLISALFLSKENIKTIIVDKHKWPIDKVCGEGIMPVGVNLLQEIGLIQHLSQNDLGFFEGINYFYKSISAFSKFKEGQGVAIRRTVLSQGLFELCLKDSNITLMPNTRFISFEKDEKFINSQVLNSEEGIQKVIKTKFIIAADGRLSSVKKFLKMQDLSPVADIRMGGRVHYKNSPWNSDRVEVHFSEKIELYITPTSKNSMGFSFGWHRDLFDLKDYSCHMRLEEKLFSFFPEIYNRIKKSNKINRFECLGPLAVACKKNHSEDVFFIGDSLLFIDQTTGEGISLLCEASKTLATCLSSIMSSDMISNKISSLENYDYVINSVKKRYISITKLSLMLTKYQLMRRFVFLLFETFPVLLKYVLELNMGRKIL